MTARSDRPDQLAARIAAGARALAVDVTAEQAAALARYVALLVTWNRRINLTAARTADKVVDDHVLDALAALPHVPGTARRLVDVGAGAGLPGLVLAICRPDVAFVLLEPIHKKHAFLAAAAREVPIPNAAPRAERLDDHLRHPDFAPYDAAISRATWPLAEWLERADPLVADGGRILGMEGREQAELPDDAVRHPYRLGDRARAIVTRDRTRARLWP
jgi:16S rRNA (guanine527-N7)-methyltransferase